MRIASSISSVVATPSTSIHSASRQTASRNRLPMKASISLRITSGNIPMSFMICTVFSTTSGGFLAEPDTSDSGSR